MVCPFLIYCRCQILEASVHTAQGAVSRGASAAPLSFHTRVRSDHWLLGDSARSWTGKLMTVGHHGPFALSGSRGLGPCCMKRRGSRILCKSWGGDVGTGKEVSCHLPQRRETLSGLHVNPICATIHGMFMGPLHKHWGGCREAGCHRRATESICLTAQCLWAGR